HRSEHSLWRVPSSGAPGGRRRTHPSRPRHAVRRVPPAVLAAGHPIRRVARSAEPRAHHGRGPRGVSGPRGRGRPPRAALPAPRPPAKGIRCCYHGWLFDVDGRTLEPPGDPADSTLKERLFHGAYPVYEYQGLVFAYLGHRTKGPISRSSTPMTCPATA